MEFLLATLFWLDDGSFWAGKEVYQHEPKAFVSMEACDAGRRFRESQPLPGGVKRISFECVKAPPGWSARFNGKEYVTPKHKRTFK